MSDILLGHGDWFTAARKRIAAGGKPADGLHPDLAAHYDDGGENGLWPLLKHPLVTTIMPIAEMANATYEYKRVEVARLKSEGSWARALWLYERPFRLETLLNWWDDGNISASLMPRLLREMWIDSEEPQIYQDELIPIFRELGFITDEEHDAPTESITVFRGTLPEWVEGMSWTRSMDIAVWFAQRFDRKGVVYTCEAEPTDILAMFDGRGEQEVVLDPSTIKGVTNMPETRAPAPSAPARNQPPAGALGRRKERQ